MSKPKISFIVATNGPVAIAGSILTLFKKIGIAAPIIVAKFNTINNVTERRKANFRFVSKNNIDAKRRTVPSATALILATPNSFKSFFNV